MGPGSAALGVADACGRSHRDLRWSSLWGHETCEGCAEIGDDDEDYDAVFPSMLAEQYSVAGPRLEAFATTVKLVRSLASKPFPEPGIDSKRTPNRVPGQRPESVVHSAANIFLLVSLLRTDADRSAWPSASASREGYAADAAVARDPSTTTCLRPVAEQYPCLPRQRP